MSWLRRRKQPQEPQQSQEPQEWPGSSGPPAGSPSHADDLFPSTGSSSGASTAWDEPAGEHPYGDEPAGAATHRSGDQGPWDVTERPELDGLVDLGGLRVPGADGMALGLQVEEETGRLIGVTIELGGSSVQLQVFAAPRTDGIWDEIRTEIAASVTKQGGTADHVGGTFGTELLARIPNSSGGSGVQVVRFAGVDGPRWFMRAVFQGPAAYQPDQALDLEEFVRGVVVVRGGEAMAPRELLSLTLPEGADQNATAEDDGTPVLRPPQRGPEITEVR